jgi:hypothetical protein
VGIEEDGTLSAINIASHERSSMDKEKLIWWVYANIMGGM